MEMPQTDLDRILFFEHARITAETHYARNPLDADVNPSLPLYSLFLHMYILFSSITLVFHIIFETLTLTTSNAEHEREREVQTLTFRNRIWFHVSLTQSKTLRELIVKPQFK